MRSFATKVAAALKFDWKGSPPSEQYLEMTSNIVKGNPKLATKVGQVIVQWVIPSANYSNHSQFFRGKEHSFRTGEMAGQLGITAKLVTDNGTRLTTVHVNNKGVAIFSKTEYNEKPTDEAEKEE